VYFRLRLWRIAGSCPPAGVIAPAIAGRPKIYYGVDKVSGFDKLNQDKQMSRSSVQNYSLRTILAATITCLNFVFVAFNRPGVKTMSFS